MRDHSGYSVSLRKPGTQEAWPELTGPDGRGYVCGVPGKPFEVVVTGPVHSLYNARAQGWQTQAQLRVDGRCAGVSLWMSPHQPSAVFQGFAVSGKGGAGSFTQQQFLFGTPPLAGSPPPKASASEAAAHEKEKSKAGSIEVTIQTVMETGRLKQTVAVVNGPGAAPKVQAVDGKKWFNQASCVADAGETVGPSQTFTSKEFRTVATLSKMELQMETAMTLQLRKIMDYQNPVHAEILRSQMPAIEDDDELPAPADAPAASTAGPRRGAAVKPEPRQQQQPKKSAVLDLTEDDEPAVKVKVKKQKR